jgi:hypothetical protein
LYGLKQAPKQWHEKFDKTLTSAGFVVNKADKCVYCRFGGGEGVILCLYVDDILIFGNNENVIKEVKDFLFSNFEMKYLGVADVILNIKLHREEGNGGISLVQNHNVEKVLSRFGYSECSPAPTPHEPSVSLRKNRTIARDQLRYSQIIGSLMYLASATRPDITSSNAIIYDHYLVTIPFLVIEVLFAVTKKYLVIEDYSFYDNIQIWL